MSDDRLKITRRDLPHWELAGSTYFITFRVQHGFLEPIERSIVIEHIRSGAPRFYDLIAALVLPDHAHVLLQPNDSVTLSSTTKGMKGVSARLINQSRETTGTIWQVESFDRIIREQTEYDEKLAYMVNNPVKAGLVADGWDYPWLFVKTTS